ncbi:hypothetical protein EYY80_29105, partial [Klebsiella oxytoca]
MIVRTWHGCVPVAFGDAFAGHLQATGVQPSRRIAGHAGAFVRREPPGAWEHFFLAPYWNDLDAIIAFAGDEY